MTKFFLSSNFSFSMNLREGPKSICTLTKGPLNSSQQKISICHTTTYEQKLGQICRIPISLTKATGNREMSDLVPQPMHNMSGTHPRLIVCGEDRNSRSDIYQILMISNSPYTNFTTKFKMSRN